MSSQSSCPEHLQAQMIIIIHPGSLNLRIGRASDFNPIRIIHAIARKKRTNGHSYRDRLLPQVTKESLTEFEEHRLQVSHIIQSCSQSDGRRRYATPPQQIAAFNRRSTPDIVGKAETNVPRTETIIGDEIININMDDPYNIHFPIKRGELNLHSELGGSLTSVMTDLQDIWEHVLKTKMGIDLSILNQYKAVLVVPDIYNRNHLKELTSLLLVRMGFGSCFLIQDHVAATFGAGLGHACVVDVGDQKTSISCVEDGISQPSTRVRLEYGGAHVTQVFHCLLDKCSFPYKECNDNNLKDVFLLKQLKEKYCHVNLDICGSQEKTFEVCHAENKLKYTIQLGDECIVAPLSLFHTELLTITGKSKAAKVQISASHQPDSEDCFDAEYIRETSRRNAREQLEQIQADGVIVPPDNQEEDLVVDSFENERDNKNDKDFVLPNGQVIGIDQAVLLSIERCPNEEMKKKMYGCVLVVGGGMKFAGIGKWLQNKMALNVAYSHRSEQLDIVTSTKDMDPAMTSWKGAAIMSCLESAPELWINQHEWQKYGLRVLREKAPFMW
ncbi:actin-related protein 8 [Eupeodes corollae]|uniref:actin-related protein 8 n=1 Tax=Eupeodes corollae TaxID=290404 RepID=UPI00249170D9|nr:actin-related protein 8 [Eupeodes corollae]